jgi:NitT/TauT family transport system substrate-binding protein
MKKIYLFCIMIFGAIGFAGCQTAQEPISVIVPSGSPALSQLFLQEDAESYRVSVVNGADPLIAAFGSVSHDVIFAPTNLGAKLIGSGSGYRFGGTVVWGNYYLVGQTEESFTLASLQNQTIVVFGANQTSDIILRFILSENGITSTFQYVDAVTTATAQFLADDSLFILTAEPSLSVLKANRPEIDIIDLQTEYQNLTGESSYPQAGVFLRSSLDPALARNILGDLRLSVERVNENPQEAAALAVSLGHPFPADVLTSAIPNSHLAFVDAVSSREALEIYFEMILQYNPNLLGGALPGDDFYWVP